MMLGGEYAPGLLSTRFGDGRGWGEDEGKTRARMTGEEGWAESIKELEVH